MEAGQAGSRHPWGEESEADHGLCLQIVTDPETDGARKLHLKHNRVTQVPEGVPRKPGPVY